LARNLMGTEDRGGKKGKKGEGEKWRGCSGIVFGRKNICAGC